MIIFFKPFKILSRFSTATTYDLFPSTLFLWLAVDDQFGYEILRAVYRTWISKTPMSEKEISKL
jgi:hypothetical protein